MFARMTASGKARIVVFAIVTLAMVSYPPVYSGFDAALLAGVVWVAAMQTLALHWLWERLLK